MANGKVYIYVDPLTPDTPWIIRYEDPKSDTGFNETRVQELEIRTSCKSVISDFPSTKGRYQIETFGSVIKHPTRPKAIIQSGSLPTPW